MIISPAELIERIERIDDPNLRIVDVRSYLDDATRGAAEYAVGHIPGAIFLDLESDLVGKESGGRHPLPRMDEFVGMLGDAGISASDSVVVYDQSHGAIAARLWWMLRHVGHQSVAVLDGGWPAWREADGPSTTAVVVNPVVAYEARTRNDDLVTLQQVATLGSRVTLVDARAPERYRGEFEPIDPIAGHIPGAINIPHESLTRGGRMLPADELTDHLVDTDAVAYCGSGVTACYVILAYAVAGLREPRLYAGSWSEWSGVGMPVA